MPTLTYDPVYHGDVLTATNPLGNSWGMHYNQYGYVITATNPLTQSARFVYNSVGWLLSSTDPRNYTSTFTYTTYGEPAIVTNTLGYTSVYTYDNVGNLINARDANGHVITNTYDLTNEPIRATKADGTHSDYGYDGLGRTITMTNGLGQLTRYSYDDINRVVTYTDALTRSTVTRFNLAGAPISLTDAKNQTTTLSYDAAYQLQGIDYSDAGTHGVQYAYNSMGARTAMTDGVGTTLYSYDSLLRPTSITDGQSHAVTYTYDLASRLTGITYPYNGSSVRSVGRGYNNANQLTSVTDWFTNTSNFAYDADGNLTTITRPNSATTSVGYNGADEAITMTQAITATPFLSFTFQLDPVGVLTKTAEANTAGSAGTHNYSYDTRNRLTNDSNATSTTTVSTWQYDAATQILNTTYKGQGVTITQPITTTRSYDAANQIITLQERTGFNGGSITKDVAYTFDANGNRTQRHDSVAPLTTNYTYDQADRLRSVGSYSYTYNGDGLRMTKTSSVSETKYTWDVGAEAGLPLLLQDNAASYIYGPGGMLLEDVVGTSSTDVYYYHGDRLGSVRALTSSAGAVSNTYTYDAYGKTLTSTGSVSNPFKYTGEYTDQESGFVYLRARYYDPESQQFLTVDPALAWTEEAYVYVGGSPTNFTDRRGLYSYTVDWEIGDTRDTLSPYNFASSTQITAVNAMGFLQNFPNIVFPFSVQGWEGETRIKLGSVYDLPGAFGIAGAFGNNLQTVRVTCVSTTSFTFTVVSGPDPAGSTITFNTYEQDGKVYLRQVGKTTCPAIINLFGFINWNIDQLVPDNAKQTWAKQAANLRNAFYQHSGAPMAVPGPHPRSPDGY